ncbi:MAG: D-alanyl-D-alanine carboxypeptidase/D-alanyl-D-alanine-endopeptidase [Deltaproteobacteria bacterium]|nr:D-alanyl-D-alanine carboxypeptidase/D-alanyl-D-alanine-endopeptidase [Deltaproteobacteria bacterium]
MARVSLAAALLLGGCLHPRGAAPPGRLASTVLPAGRALPRPAAPASQPTTSPASQPAATSQPAVDRTEQLRTLLQAELAHPDLAKAKVSLVAAPLLEGEPLFSAEPEARRLPASNAKLLTTSAAAALLPGRYQFVTEVSRKGVAGPLYLWSTGDPVLRRADLVRLARAVRAEGVTKARGVVVDASHFEPRTLAPGFESFAEGSYYRPSSGALNVDGNVLVIQVSAPADRKRPRVDVFPPSDYVIVRKRVRYSPAKRGKALKGSQVKITLQVRGATIWITVAGTIGRKAPPYQTRRAVPNPALNVGWAFRRALKDEGVTVLGGVRAGRRPREGKVLARRVRALQDVLLAANRDSDNLAAETLVRAMGQLRPAAASETDDEEPPTPRAAVQLDSWGRGLARLTEALGALGVTDFKLSNGSGLDRRAHVTAQGMVALLRRVYGDPKLRALLLPTLSVAGRSGTLGGRLRGTPAAGVVRGKTGTLAGALALSGYVDVGGPHPLVFSMLVNGRADRRARSHIDRVAELLARFAKGLPLATETPASAPSTQPVSEETPPDEG